jgi:uncharacterized protein with PIN domain
MSDRDETNAGPGVPKCPSCLQTLNDRVLELFDPQLNRAVQLFQCHSCRKHVWEDEVARDRLS